MSRKLDEAQDRGDFFKSLGTLVGGFFANRIEEAVTASAPKLLRPPGALDEFAFLVVCTRCDKCIPVCPQSAIVKASPSAGLAMGTPYIVPRAMPCFLCTELPCVKACPEGALLWPTHGELSGPAAVRMGLAVVKESLCITYDHEECRAIPCTTCVDRCPYPGEAIRMSEVAEGEIAHPMVMENRCTGCGLCEFACPGPKSAIVVEPRKE
jgi:MauM/NapG family ferredoxin protein